MRLTPRRSRSAPSEFGSKKMRQRRQSCPKITLVVFRIRDSRPTKCVQRDGRPIAFTQVMGPTQPVASTPELTTLRPGGSVDQTTRAAQNSDRTKTKAIKIVLKSVARNHRRELTANELARVGVESLGKNTLVLSLLCKTVWTPSLTAAGSLHPFYWRCANRCNW
jgi:hypothetical protein